MGWRQGELIQLSPFIPTHSLIGLSSPPHLENSIPPPGACGLNGPNSPAALFPIEHERIHLVYFRRPARTPCGCAIAPAHDAALRQNVEGCVQALLLPEATVIRSQAVRAR